MSTIKVFALGGLGEIGKNMFVIEVDEKIFVLEAGSQNPPTEMYGIDAIFPDIRYLVANKERIQGIFISHGHEDRIGAISEVLKNIKVNIYASKFTMNVLKDCFTSSEAELYSKNLKIITEDKKLKFGNITVEFFKTTHSIPESLGTVISTEDGCIVYTGDYTFNTHVKKSYKTSYDKISALKSRKVLCLLADSTGCGYQSTGESNYLLEHSLDESIRSSRRILITAFSNELDKIQTAIDIALKYDRRIAIIGRKAQRIVDVAINLGYLSIPKEKLYKLKFVDGKVDNYADDLVVLITGDRHEPYYMLQRIGRKLDKLIHLDKRDTVVIITTPHPGVEKMAANTIDLVYKSGANIKIVNNKLLRGSHASVHDTKLFYNLVEPEYVIPVIGEYRHQYAQYEAAKEYGFTEDKIVLLENGEVATFVDGVKEETTTKIETGDVLVDGSMIGDINAVVLKDRDSLANEGILIIIGNIDARKKLIYGTPEVLAPGFILERDFPEVFKRLREIYVELSQEHFDKKYIDWSSLKQDIKDKIQKHIMDEIGIKTHVLPVLIDTLT